MTDERRSTGPAVMMGDPDGGGEIFRSAIVDIAEGHAGYFPSGAPRRSPHDLERSRRHGVIGRPGPLPYFGPVTQIDGVQFTEENTPHRCVECGARDHAGINCPKYKEGEGR